MLCIFKCTVTQIKKPHLSYDLYPPKNEIKAFVFEIKVAQQSTPSFLVDWFYFNSLKRFLGHQFLKNEHNYWEYFYIQRRSVNLLRKYLCDVT